MTELKRLRYLERAVRQLLTILTGFGVENLSGAESAIVKYLSAALKGTGVEKIHAVGR